MTSSLVAVQYIEKIGKKVLHRQPRALRAECSHFRAVAPSPAGPAMAGPVFAVGTKILNIEDMHSKHTSNWEGGTGLRLKNVLKAEWSCYSVAGLSLNKE